MLEYVTEHSWLQAVLLLSRGKKIFGNYVLV